jgi:predicted anti-sigma-YlaC factor YlaD
VKCKRAQRLLPLLIGSEISPSRAEHVRKHLKQCSQCRIDYEAIEQSTQKMREWLRQERMDWEEDDWKKALQKAGIDFSPRRSSLSPWPLKKGWAYALMAGTAALLFLFVIQPSFIKTIVGNKSFFVSQNRFLASKDLKGLSSQDIVSMRIVSEETGLKINWFFHKNFEIKEDIK